MPLQRCLGGTNRDCEYNWVILMHGPQGLCDLKGLFCWVQPARGRLQNHEISHCFPLRWCCQFLTFQGGYLEENIVLFSLLLCCPAMEMERWENASLLQVSCSLHTTMSVLMYLQFWSFFFLYFFPDFSVVINRKSFSCLKLELVFLTSSKLFLRPSSDVSLLYVIMVKPSDFLYHRPFSVCF